MNKTYIYGIGNALVDSEYKITDEELLKLNLKKAVWNLMTWIIIVN